MATSIRLDGATLTRVLYLDAAIDPEPTGLTPDEVRSVTWAEPTWADNGQVRAASCCWVIEAGERRVVVDPSGNLDEILHDPATTTAHQDAYTAAFEAAGLPIDTIDGVLLSHIESVGLSAVRADNAQGWRRFFGNARLLISDRSLDDFGQQPRDGDVGDAFAGLVASGLVDTFADGDEVIPGVHAEWTGMHNPGHCAFHVAGGAATFVGHLAVTPVHFGSGPNANQHYEPNLAWDWLERVKADGRVLIGPLWPSPGAGRWEGDRFAPYA